MSQNSRLFLAVACAAAALIARIDSTFSDTPEAHSSARSQSQLAADGWGTAELHQNIVYIEVGDRKLHLDIAVPDAAAPLPAIVMFPGNAPVPQPRQVLYPQMRFFARHGYIAASLEYRGPGEGRFPASVDDAKNAVRFLRRHAAEYHVDPQHIGAWGMSMGGGVALMLAVTGDDFGTSKNGPHARFSSRVQAVVDRYGPADLTTMPLDPARGLIMVLCLGTADPKSRELHEASPLFHVSKTSAPVLALHSRKDQVVPFHQSELLCEAMRKAGVPTELHEIPVNGHTEELFQQTATNRAAGDACLIAEAAWFDRFLKKAKTE